MTEWAIITIFLSLSLYLSIMVFYYKVLLKREKESNIAAKEAFDDAEEVVEKYQIQLKRSLENIDMLSDELDRVKNDLKSIKIKNSQYKMENNKLKEEVKERADKREEML